MQWRLMSEVLHSIASESDALTSFFDCEMSVDDAMSFAMKVRRQMPVANATSFAMR